MMNKKKLTGLVLAAGLIAGTGFGVQAMAGDNPITQTTQTQTENQPKDDRGFFGGGFMQGSGSCHGFGGYNSHLSAAQQKELNLLRAESQNVMVDFSESMAKGHENLDKAIGSGDKAAILAAWKDLGVLHEEIKEKLQPVYEKIAAITGEKTDDAGFPGMRYEHSRLSEIMTRLETASDEAAADIIKDLQSGKGFGRGSFMHQNFNGMMGPMGGKGHMGGRGMMGPGWFQGNWNNGGQDGQTK